MAPSAIDLCWVDGRLARRTDPLLRVDDSAFTAGRGCFSTARWTGRATRYVDRHVARLARDARSLGIGEIDPALATQAFEQLGRAAFGTDGGVLRLQASRASDGGVTLVALARALAPETQSLRAITLPFRHEGAGPFVGAKVSNRLLHALAAEFVGDAGADEGLLFDEQGRLVEGTRSNLVTVAADGALWAPPEARGAVAGVALEIICDAIPALVRADRRRSELPALHEMVALNAVRGACPITELDGRPVGDGLAGPAARMLADALDAAD